MKYVIIGNSAAGIGAVEGIRQVDPSGEITIITNETHHTYSRPLISYLLLGKTTEQRMLYRGDTFYEDNACTVLRGVTATELDVAAQCVVLDSGERVPYDKLLVATGSRAFVPPFEGLETVSSKCSFMSLDDARTLDAMLDRDKRVLIIGAGLIGLKCAEGILDKVAQLTVVDLAPKVLSSILDDDSARLVQAHLEENGMHFILGDSVKRFEANTAFLESGSSVPFEVLVLAVGVRPNTELLSGFAEIERGIVINERSETSAAGIYAAGDCTQTYDVSSGQNRIMALLPNAYMQGECAGINMAGGNASFDKAIPMNAIGFFGLHIITAGNYLGDVYSEYGEAEDGASKSFKRLFHSDNRLNGFILIGKVEKAGIYTSLIREHTPLDSIDFELVCSMPGLMAFTKKDRMIKLGGMTA